MKNRSIILFLALFYTVAAYPQDISRVFRDIVIRIDTNAFSMARDQVTYQGIHHLAFRFTDQNPVCEINLYAAKGRSLEGLNLLPSGDF